MKSNKIISCRIATELMSKSFEKPLTKTEKLKLKAHLIICHACILCFKQMQCISKTMKLFNKIITINHSPIVLPLHRQKSIQLAILKELNG